MVEGKTDSLRTRDSDVRSVPLVEKMDAELGEASTGIGSILTEFVRRTLRTGIQKVDEELQDRVDEKVGASVNEHMPAIEDAAREVAGKRVEGLETELKSTVTRIDHDIEETERRTDENARKVIVEQLEAIKTRSKSTADELQEHINKVQAYAASLEKRIAEETARRESVEQKLSHALQQSMQQAGNLMQKQTDILHKKLEQAEERLAELEKPRGLKKLFGGFGGKKKKPAVEEAESGEE